MVVISFQNFVFDEYKKSPQEVIDKAVNEWQNDQKKYNLINWKVSSVIGWREYMRYLLAKMPEYASLNYFNNQEKLPEWFWTGEKNELRKRRH
jgi:deoxyribodipyrimidine photolyase-related protein